MKLFEKGNVTFSQGENGQLIMTAGAERFSFCDSVSFENQQLWRSSAAYSLPTFSEHTRYEAGESILLCTTPMDKGLTVYNRFTVQENAVTMDTWFESDAPVYDCSAVIGHTELSFDGFAEIGSTDSPRFFPFTLTPPTYGFHGDMILRGERRYLKVCGGFLWQDGSMIDAHFQMGTYGDDLAWYGAENPIRTAYIFAENATLPAPAPAKKEQPAITGSIQSGALRADYAVKKDGAVFVSGGETPMAAMLVRDLETGEKIYLDTASGWERVAANGTEFAFLNHTNAPGVGIRLIADTTREDRIAWTVEAVNTSEQHTLLWCTYPRLTVAPDGIYDLFVPYGGGFVEAGFNRTDCFKAGAYPGGLSYSLPYLAAWSENRGIYFGVHDGSGSYKDFTAASDSRGFLRFNCKYCAPNIGAPANGFALAGEAIWQAYNGDWFDAAELYRAFVEKCGWYPKAGENGREDIPLWLRDLPFWTMDWVPHEAGGEPIPDNLRPKDGFMGENAWFEAPIKLREALGVPFGYHVYNWHKIPFNNDYPHFLPEKNCVQAGFAKLQQAGIRVMPYINALIWDVRDRGAEDWQFSAVGKAGAVKDDFGQPHVQIYASRESDGSRVQLATMCPGAPVWRQTLRNLITEMFAQLPIDGIYLDQTAAHAPRPCTDKTHPHAPGGGDWWVRETCQMLRYLNEAKPDGCIFTSEANAETYASDLDGFLSWNWISVDKYVPAFMRIYGGKVVIFGRNANGYMKENTTYWKYHLAQGLVAGEQMGWINSDFVNDPHRLAFAKKLIGYRYENRAFFRAARPMRPPVAETDKTFACGIGMQWQGVLHEPLLTVGALENGSRRKLLAVNLSDGEMTEKVWISSELGLQDFALSGDGSAERTDENHLRVTVPAGGLLALSWEA